MDKGSKPGSDGLPSNGIVAIVLLAAGVLFVREAPLETTRLPANEPRIEQPRASQDVDARLWQDPFGAIGRSRAQLSGGNQDKADKEDKQHTDEILAKDVRDVVTAPEGKKVVVLAVMLPGGPYSENIESRRRGRYAVLAALNASRLSPVDTEHLGYFKPTGMDRSPEPSEATPAIDPAEAQRKPAKSQELIPYEWFQPASDVAPQALSTSSLQSRVLVMWLQTEAFSSEPLTRMAELAKPFIKAGADWRVLGPNGSDGLKAVIDEAGRKGYAARPEHKGMRFYSLYATVPDKVLLEGRTDKKEQVQAVSPFLESRGIRLVRTIGDDGRLADALIDELRLRGLSPHTLSKEQDDGDALSYQETCRTRRAEDDNDRESPSRIAVVAEWDTLYGRSLLREFRASKDESGFCVERFNYVRGLDGQLPTAAGGDSGAGGAPKAGASDKDATRRKDGTFIEVAEGQSQFDYLRRLAVQMRMKDEQLRGKSGNGEGFRAIGVLGNDLHDKLLVLQALRPEFPNAIFFTTDMDARLLHPREQAWTRNLIVASNFGLRLTDPVQGSAPPFRDSYQVSAFLSTRLAMDDARRELQLEPGAGDARLPLSQERIRKWLDKPRIFEIGRTTAFDFTGRWPREMNRPSCRGLKWSQCEDIHPAGSRPYPSPGVPVMFLIFSGLMLLLWLPSLAVSRGANAWLGSVVASRDKPRARWWRWSALALFILVMQVALPLAMAIGWEPFAAWVTEGGKPMLAIEGISPWPTEALRIVALLLCFYLLVRGWLLLTYNLEEIAASFDSGVARQDMAEQQESAETRQRRWRKLVQMFSLRFIVPLHQEEGEDHGMTPDAVDFWGRHIVQNRLVARLVRTACAVLVAALLSGIIVAAVGETRFVPQRGDLSFQVHECLRVPALVMMYFLIFFVVDATVLCVRFVRGLLRLRRLHEYAANWPEATLVRFEQEMGLPRAYLENWIDLQFIARRTESVTRLIYYPFIVISLWLLSRSVVFDHWTLSVGTLLPAAFGAAVALGCAVALRLAAEESRTHALEQVKNEVLRASARPPAGGPNPLPTVEQLKLLQARIESLHDGAFAPFWQQPLLKAMLLPFATLGGTTVLDYMALANL